MPDSPRDLCHFTATQRGTFIGWRIKSVTEAEASSLPQQYVKLTAVPDNGTTYTGSDAEVWQAFERYVLSEQQRILLPEFASSTLSVSEAQRLIQTFVKASKY